VTCDMDQRMAHTRISVHTQYPNPEIAPVAQLVEQKLEELVAEATGGGQEIHSDIGGDFR